jgi:hypothetical protein
MSKIILHYRCATLGLLSIYCRLRRVLKEIKISNYVHWQYQSSLGTLGPKRCFVFEHLLLGYK